jgi:hypothetical protein
MDSIDPATKFSVVGLSLAAKQVGKTAAITLPNAWLENIEIFFAPGVVALVNAWVSYAGNTVLPWDGIGGSVVGDNERLQYPMGMYMPGPITVHGTNNGVNAHQIYFTFRWHTYVDDTTVTPLQTTPLVIA